MYSRSQKIPILLVLGLLGGVGNLLLALDFPKYLSLKRNSYLATLLTIIHRHYTGVLLVVVRWGVLGTFYDISIKYQSFYGSVSPVNFTHKSPMVYLLLHSPH